MSRAPPGTPRASRCTPAGTDRHCPWPGTDAASALPARRSRGWWNGRMAAVPSSTGCGCRRGTSRRHRGCRPSRRVAAGTRLRRGEGTHLLVARGIAVTAVDESPGMLAHVRGARTLCAAIGELDLAGERFDAVVLVPYPIPHADAAVRHGMLRACVRHTTDGGAVLVQRLRRARHGRCRARSCCPAAVWPGSCPPRRWRPRHRQVPRRVRVSDARWPQTFPSCEFPGRETFARTLAGAGLAVESELTPDGSWLLRHGECDGRSGALTALRVDWR